jgi:hypothetical protein
LRPHFVAHVALGALALGAVLAHAGAHVPANAAGALQIAFWLAAVFGAACAIAYRVLPERLAKIERGGALPEDLAARASEIDERIFRELTGKSDAVKAIYARVLRPYERARLGAALLIARGARLKDEEARLLSRIDRILASRASDRAGLSELVRLVVERRAIAAQRVLTVALRVWLPLHVAACAIAAALLLAHVAFALRSFR